MRKVSSVIFCAVCIAGCGKKPADVPPPVAETTTQPAATTQTSLVTEGNAIAATRPIPVQLTVGGEPIDFAAAKLTLHTDGGDVQFTLTAEDHTAGSSTTFRLGGTVHDVTPADLPGEAFHRVVDPADPNTPDSPDGLLMTNGAVQFEPRDVTVRFGGTYPRLTVSIVGVFERLDANTQPVNVTGEWTVAAEER